MSIFHIEVHTRDRQIEHFITPNCVNQAEAEKRILQYYADCGRRLGFWNKESDRNNGQITHLIFNVIELEGDPVLYISGEYRSLFPV